MLTIFNKYNKEFLSKVERVLDSASILTGYKWIILKKSNEYSKIKRQNGLYIKYKGENSRTVCGEDGGMYPDGFNLSVDVVPVSKSGEILWIAPRHVWQTMGDVAVRRNLIWGGNFINVYHATHIESNKWKDMHVLHKIHELILSGKKPCQKRINITK